MAKLAILLIPGDDPVLEAALRAVAQQSGYSLHTTVVRELGGVEEEPAHVPHTNEEWNAINVLHPERFSDEAIRVLLLAQEEARRLNHNYVGTEHLLLGLVGSDTVASRVLRALGCNLETIRAGVEHIVGPGDRRSPARIVFTLRAQTNLELAEKEAQGMNSPTVKPEHLLLGLLREGYGIGAGVLESLGISLNRVRAQIEYRSNHPMS